MSHPNYKSTVRACYTAFVTQAVVINLPPLFFVMLQGRYGMFLTLLGGLVFLNFIVQLIVDALCIKLLDKIGYRRAAVAAHALAAAGLAALGILPGLLDPYTGLAIATVIFSVGSGVIEVSISPLIDSLPTDAKAASMSLSHSFYSWGHVIVVVVTTLALKLTGMELWYILPVLWALLPLYNMLQFLRVPIAPVVSGDRRTPVRRLVRSSAFIFILIAMICAGASEQAMAQWASMFTEKVLGLSKATGDLLGPCAFAVSMGLGRVLFGIYGKRLRLIPVLSLCCIICALSYIAAALSPLPALSLAGCALCGLSVSILWPCTLSLAASQHPAGGSSMFAMLSLCGDAGCALGPWLVGIVSDTAASGTGGDSSGLQTGLTAAAVLPLTALVCMLVIRYRINIVNSPKPTS